MAQGDAFIVAEEVTGGTTTTIDIRPAAGVSVHIKYFGCSIDYQMRGVVDFYDYSTSTRINGEPNGWGGRQSLIQQSSTANRSNTIWRDARIFLDNTIGLWAKFDSGGSGDECAVIASGIQVK